MALREDPVIPPRTLFASLPKAVEAALDHENLPGNISLDRWATTFNTSASKIAAEFDKQRRERATRIPPNSIEGGEGK